MNSYLSYSTVDTYLPISLSKERYVEVQLGHYGETTYTLIFFFRILWGFHHFTSELVFKTIRWSATAKADEPDDINQVTISLDAIWICRFVVLQK